MTAAPAARLTHRITRDAFGVVLEYLECPDTRSLHLHRRTGPAIQRWSSSGKVPVVFGWFRHGKHHRLEGPAQVNLTPSDAVFHWYHERKLHRLDGPVVVYSGGRLTWDAPDFARFAVDACGPSLDQDSPM